MMGIERDRLLFHGHTNPHKAAAIMQSASTASLQRKIRPLLPSKRTRIFAADAHENQGPAHDWPGQHQHHHHPDYSTPLISPQMRPKPTTDRPNTSALLSPCHICHRKPTRKTDLDSFADCEGCGQRTCFVCIRQCQGWLQDGATRTEQARQAAATQEEDDELLSRSFTMLDADDDLVVREEEDHRPSSTIPRDKGTGWNAHGHCSMICSGCCIERGIEGDVVCLGCLAGMEGA
jgi:hypothetical protein